MNLVHRHLLRNFARNLSYTIVGALVLFSLVDLLDHMGSFVDNHATATMVGRYYIYKSVWIIDTVLPIAILMATLFTVGGMARYLELTALFAAGWSLMKVCRPLIICGVVLSLVSLAWREYVLPEANLRLNHVWEVEIHKNPDRIRPTRQIAITDSQGRLYYVRRFDPNTGVITGLKIITYRASTVIERIDAERATWDGEYWKLSNGTRRLFQGDEETTNSFTNLTARDLDVDPRSFYSDRIRPEDMNIRQSLHYVDLVRKSGGDPTSALVDIQFNLAFPLINLIVILMGILLASGPRKTNVASGFGLTMLISFGYYLFMNFGRSLGHSGTVSPLLAAWSGNLVYAAIFGVLFIRAKR